jgi:hypothetical protein
MESQRKLDIVLYIKTKAITKQNYEIAAYIRDIERSLTKENPDVQIKYDVNIDYLSLEDIIYIKEIGSSYGNRFFELIKPDFLIHMRDEQIKKILDK